MTAQELLDLLGPAALLNVQRGAKNPILTGWQKLSIKDMTPEYLNGLNGENNVGVSLGPASENLCTIDCDDIELARQFQLSNPKLAASLMSRGERGANFWIRIKGDYPKSCKLRTKDGGKWGEWRAEGNQTIIQGFHPCGISYRHNGKHPVEIAFEKIIWPDDVELPWVPKPEPEPEPAAPPPRLDRNIDAELIRKCGPAYHITEKGNVIPNQSYFVQRFCMENDVAFEQDEDAFYRYESETGAWSRVASDVIKEMFRVDWEDIAHAFGEDKLLVKNTNSFQNAIVDGIKAFSGRTKIFKRLKRIVHCQNGMLKIHADGSWELTPFSPGYYSRNPLPINSEPASAMPALSGDPFDPLRR